MGPIENDNPATGTKPNGPSVSPTLPVFRVLAFPVSTPVTTAESRSHHSIQTPKGHDPGLDARFLACRRPPSVGLVPVPGTQGRWNGLDGIAHPLVAVWDHRLCPPITSTVFDSRDPLYSSSASSDAGRIKSLDRQRAAYDGG
ncbi:hypothetical protein CCUS01_00261 [Colletotrichum cuscutae]|uniref:Uncharacterized protein n=1 Tax=Colletotrichum cuscutae TaxID=1209917 RepID=A0AAI9YE63_9PEZI|nr:hypothetical protein CCUS01_00261 [Colletotrichum cuscutae]